MTAVTGQVLPLAGLVAQAGGRAIVLALSKDPNGKVTVLLFGPGSDLPDRVAKVPCTELAVGSVETEATRLGGIDRAALGDLADTVPAVVAMAEHEGRPVLVTTWVPGRLMLASYHAWRHTARPALVRADFAAAGHWLASLQDRTRNGTADLSGMVAGLPEAFARRFAGDPDAATAATGLATLRGRLAGHQVPRVLVHGDYWPGNLLIADGQVRGVVDWENGRPAGLPSHDLARFALSYSLYLGRAAGPGRRVPGHPGLRAGPWDAGLRYALRGRGWYPDLVTGFVAAGLGRLGVPGGLARDVLLAEIATMAAEADHPEFARQHLHAFCRLSLEA